MTKLGEIQDPTGGTWDECIASNTDEVNETSRWWSRIAYTLLLVSAFLLGRAYGWYEVHLYMKHVAEGLRELSGSLR